MKIAGTVVRVPTNEKWNKELLAKIGCTPYDMHQPREPEVIFKEKTDDKVGEPQQKITVARQVYIKPSDIEKYRITRGCRKCDHDATMVLAGHQWGTPNRAGTGS